MSQEKVERYKQEKAKRKETMRKERIKHVIRKCIVCLAALALFSWIGYSAYAFREEKKPRQVAEVNYTEFQNYLDSIDEAQTE